MTNPENVRPSRGRMLNGKVSLVLFLLVPLVWWCGDEATMQAEGSGPNEVASDSSEPNVGEHHSGEPGKVKESVMETLDFNRDIRPILSDKCYFCHGPDEENRQADLRLDSRDDAIDLIESGEVLDRVLSEDPGSLMPPPKSKLSLTDQEKKLLQRWVDEGAQYENHWAFENLPEAIEVPSTHDAQWCRQTLDRFVLSKLEKLNARPIQEADPLRWLRRVSLDLTGLPPTPDQIKRFSNRLATEGEATYEHTVDGLLKSDSFGEHMAVAWLDTARYADSYGYQSDKLNTQWPYRDWVVRAFNENLSYDQFLTWQLAGDLLDSPTREQRLATAFNRIHRLNNEGGAVFEEWRIENVADRVHTFGTAVLGLTMECCRCHDHKYDPIPARDYYALSAFFNSIDESGVYDRSEKVPCPSVLLPTTEQETALNESRARLMKAEQAYRRAVADSNQRWQTWAENQASAPESPAPQIPDLRLALSFDRGFDNSLKQIYHPSKSDRAWAEMPDLVPVNDSPVARMASESAQDLEGVKATPGRMAMVLDGERGITAKGIEPFDRWTPFSVVISLRESQVATSRSLIAHHTRGTDCGYNGWDLTIENGYLESRMARVWPGNAISVRTVRPIPHDVWHQVAATYDGSSTAKGLKLFLNGQELETLVIRDELKKSSNVLVDHGGEFVLGQRFRARGLDKALIDDVRVYLRDLTQPELTWLADATPDSFRATSRYYESAIDPATRKAANELMNARKAWVMAEEVIDEVPIMREMSQPRTTHLLARGQYDAATDESTLVQRATLSSIGLPFPEGAPLDRLGLAQWVTDPRHPLTSRVAVNRFWGNFFASPLVRTPENFGLQGELPTHPELLDWLARDFINHGWDVKRLCKQIVLSATYRQDSVADKESLEKDPTNRFLARGPAYRLSAEQIRDLALAGSSLLNEKRGGPPVSPYQPGGDLWRESNGMSPPYQQSVGRSLYRRSLYSVWKRTAPLPNMMAFDSTAREVCTVKRSRTNTPLQALVLLNDVQFVEASRALAQKVLSSTPGKGRDNDLIRIHDAFVRLASRQPDPRESEILLTLFQDEQKYYSGNVGEANKFVSLGEQEFVSELDPVEVAAMTVVCQAILNLDATIWKR